MNSTICPTENAAVLDRLSWVLPLALPPVTATLLLQGHSRPHEASQSPPNPAPRVTHPPPVVLQSNKVAPMPAPRTVMLSLFCPKTIVEPIFHVPAGINTYVFTGAESIAD